MKIKKTIARLKEKIKNKNNKNKIFPKYDKNYKFDYPKEKYPVLKDDI